MVSIYEITYVLPVYSSTGNTFHKLFMNLYHKLFEELKQNTSPNISVLCLCFLTCQSLAGKKTAEY